MNTQHRKSVEELLQEAIKLDTYTLQQKPKFLGTSTTVDKHGVHNTKFLYEDVSTEAKEVRFLHIRKHTKEGAISPTGGVTVAVAAIDKNKYAVNVAACSDKDVFCKKLGRAIAEGRLLKHLASSANYSEKLVKDILFDIAKEVNATVVEHQVTSLLAFKV